jgi:hypothetical protein
MYRKISLSTSVLLIYLNCLAWKSPIKFGEVELKDLEMSICDIDSSAEAVVLCHYGYFNAQNFTFQDHIRIKILKKEGLKWANYVFNTSAKGDINGYTFNLENGEIIKSKLTRESVFEDRIIDKYYNYRVAMPNVKVGSVVDIKCNYNGVPFWWNFQQQIPVKWSELIVEPHGRLGIKQDYFGLLKYYIQEDYRWVVKDAPAIHEEPFINSINNYKQRIEMVFYNKFMGCNWETENHYLLNDCYYFGYPTKSVIFVNKYIIDIREKSNSEQELIKNAFEFVRKSVKWNEENRIYTSSTLLHEIFNKGIGNSADINLLLYVVLKKLDFEVYPVLISKRENGVLLPSLPNLYKPNFVIVFLKGKERNYFLDATEKYNPYDLLPEQCLNGKGRIIDETKSDWINIETEKKDIFKSVYNLELNENLLFKGTINNIRENYNAFNFRKRYFSNDSEEEFLKNYLEEKPGLEIQDFKAVNDEYKVSISNFITPIDSELYIRPLFYEAIDKNPFNNDSRIFPIDFIYPKEITVIINLKIPDNYSVVSMPAPVLIKLPDNSAKCIYNISAINNKIILSYQYKINRVIYLPNEYSLLQEFYSQIVKKHSEPIILRLN